MSLRDLENVVEELSETIKDAYEALSNDEIESAKAILADALEEDE